MTEPFDHRIRDSAGDPEGIIVLFHGRGADEHDLYPLFDIFDPEGRFLGVTPRAPYAFPTGGAHWYVVKEVGFPDPVSFWPTFDRVSSWLDDFVASNQMSYDRVVLGGFSQGAVMSFALGLAKGRPVPAGIAAFSGFIPGVEGLEFDLARRCPIAIGHGIHDPIISVDFSRVARDRLTEAGFDVLYREYPLPHMIEPAFAQEVGTWINALLVEPDREPR